MLPARAEQHLGIVQILSLLSLIVGTVATIPNSSVAARGCAVVRERERGTRRVRCAAVRGGATEEATHMTYMMIKTSD
jgi:hypothetical protein